MQAVLNENQPKRAFFLDGPGGSGKSYLYNTLMCVLRGQGETLVPIAFTGQAATLLKGGRTAHSQFKLPVPIVETSTAGLRLDTPEALRVKNAKLILWDEVTMAPSHALNAIDIWLQDLMQNHKPFGGKVMLLGGDFRQTLPVIPRGHRAAIVGATIKCSKSWKHFISLKLTSNMRANADELSFANWLIQLGDGKLQSELGEDIIEIPQACVVEGSIVDAVFGEKILPEDMHMMHTKAILCPKNEEALGINEDVLKRLPGEMKTYYSVDTANCDDPSEALNYPVEFLNTLTPSGLPPHKLNLKVGAVIMLLRNLNTSRGLCNGTRLIVMHMMENIIHAKVLTGTASGQQVFIPRVNIDPSETNLPFSFIRRQFPIRVSYCMTINKGQGQTFDVVGIYLPEPVFSHGQLYVAFSRAKSEGSVKVKVLATPKQGKLKKNSDRVFTVNCVYKEVFN
jgi:hypothetical protein